MKNMNRCLGGENVTHNVVLNTFQLSKGEIVPQ